MITLQPVSQAVGAGATVTFSVEATGTALSYQWMFNGDPILGATATAYIRSNVQEADSGVYTVTVANLAGSVTSDAGHAADQHGAQPRRDCGPDGPRRQPGRRHGLGHRSGGPAADAQLQSGRRTGWRDD